MGSTRIQEVAEGQGVRRQRKSKPRGSESATQGNRQKRVCRGGDTIVRRGNEAATQGNRQKKVCRGWDSIVRRSSAAAIQGISGKRVYRGRNSMGRKGNEATTQGNQRKRVCRGRDEMGRRGNGTKKEKFLQNLEEPRKRKNTRQYRGKDDTGGWKDSSLTLRMTV